MRVVFTGGGTGGHLYPALAVARALRALRPEVEPFFVGARRGIEQFNQGHYYPAHDALEAAWMEDAGPGRDLYRGILQVGIAYYQIEQGNYRGAVKMLLRVRQWLGPLPDTCRGVDVAALRADVERVYAALVELGPKLLADFDRALFGTIQFT